MLNLSNYNFYTNRTIIASGVIGNLLESFDVMICAFLAPTLAFAFFSPDTATNNLFHIFNIFLVAYIARPVGSLLIGLFADQIGRKKTLIFSIVTIGIGTTTLGLIPTYQSIGIISTCLFLASRILQNLSAGGEYISSIAYLIESGGKSQRGYYGSWVALGINSGTLLASVSVFTVTYLIDTHIIPSWSWRIIFVLGSLGMLLGLKIRLALPESLDFMLEHSRTKTPKKLSILITTLNIIKLNPYQCLSIFFITWLGVYETFSVFIYSPIQMTTINHLSQHAALGINTLSLIFLIIFIPVFGYLSDYYNKIKVLIITSIFFIILSFPCFILLSSGSFYQILVLKLFIAIPSACYFSIAPVVITETFPLAIRCTSIGLLYQISGSLAAGLTPLIMFNVIKFTHQSYSPAYLLIASAICAIAGLTFLKTKLISEPSNLNKKTDNLYKLEFH